MTLQYSDSYTLCEAETEGGEGDEGDEEGEQPDSDEERENQRAARIKAAQTEAVNGGTSGAQQTPPGGVRISYSVCDCSFQFGPKVDSPLKAYKSLSCSMLSLW